MASGGGMLKNMRLWLGLLAWCSIVGRRGGVLSAKCPFDSRCQCPKESAERTFDTVECKFGKEAPMLKIDSRRGKFTVVGEFSIIGNFEKGFSIVAANKRLADAFESIGKLTLRNTVRTASWSLRVKRALVLSAPVQELEIDGFRGFAEGFQWCEKGCWQDVQRLTIKNSKLNDYKEAPGMFVRGFPKLTALTMENTEVQSLAPTAFEPMIERLTELTLIRCNWREYPTVEYLTKLTKLTMENSKVHDDAEKKSCAFCSLESLQELHLAGSDIQFALDAEAFQHLPDSLDTIVLSGGLTQVPYDVTQNKVPRLIMADNEIASIGDNEFHMYNSLQYVSFANNPIESITPDAFEELKSVEELVLTNTHVHEFDLSLLSAKMTSLKSLELDGNRLMQEITVSSAEQLPPNLERVSLTNSKIQTIPDSMKDLLNMPNFQTLDISDTVITLCEEIKWIVPYAMCEGSNKKVVFNENTRCGNANLKQFAAFMGRPGRRVCEEAAAAAEAEAPPAEEAAPADDEPPPAAATTTREIGAGGGDMKLTLSESIKQELTSLGKSAVWNKVRLCITMDNKKVGGQCPKMEGKAGQMLQECLRAAQRGNVCEQAKLRKIAVYMVEAATPKKKKGRKGK